MKKEYFTPEVKMMLVDVDIITYSETDEWEGPVIQAGHDSEESSTQHSGYSQKQKGLPLAAAPTHRLLPGVAKRREGSE